MKEVKHAKELHVSDKVRWDAEDWLEGTVEEIHEPFTYDVSVEKASKFYWVKSTYLIDIRLSGKTFRLSGKLRLF